MAAAGGLAAVLAIGGGMWRTRSVPPPASGGGSRIGGPFTLIDTHGRRVTDRDLLGKPTLIYFGYTYCPDVCPTTLAAIGAWLKALGPDADRLNMVFVTVDPQRDTPERLGLYLAAFDPRIRGLTGTPAQIAQAAKQYLIVYQRVDLGNGDYTVDHSTSLYVMDRQGHETDVIGDQEPAADAIAKLRAALRD
jgi:protein SCO1/2